MSKAIVNTIRHEGMECIVIDGTHHHVKHLAPYVKGQDRIKDTFLALGYTATYYTRYVGEIHYTVEAVAA